MKYPSTLKIDPREWTVSDVKIWLCANDLADFSELFCDIHHISGEILLSLRFRDLICYPIMISAYGDARRIIMKISELRYKSMGLCNSTPILEYSKF